jgi:aminopeptidase
MTDLRIEQYARILVDTCLDIRPEQTVLLVCSPLGRPLVEELIRQIARKGAYVQLKMTFTGNVLDLTWVREAPLELLSKPVPFEVHALESADAVIAVVAPENSREASAVAPERMAAVQAAMRPALERMMTGELQWTGGQYPCPSLAQEAGMSLDEFEDFLYGAVLLDWNAEKERMRRYADRFDAADEVRLVGPGTDLTLNIAGRVAMVDAGGANMPGGEFFYSPVEDSAQGVIHFSEFPGFYGGREVNGIRLRFEDGVAVEATADSEEEFLNQMLDSDEGARRIGELGIGCNPGITRYMKNTLFDEKIDGTAHIAVGNGFPFLGGSNVSQIHWDIVKDLRNGGRIELDGEIVQENGVWRI